MRRYSRRHGRFSQPDPYGGSYDLTDPQSFNRYSYVQNDPVNFTDPTGLVQDPNDAGPPPPDDGPPDVVIPSWAGRLDPFFFGLDGPFGARGIRRPITEFEPRKADGSRRDLIEDSRLAVTLHYTRASELAGGEALGGLPPPVPSVGPLPAVENLSGDTEVAHVCETLPLSLAWLRRHSFLRISCSACGDMKPLLG